MPDPWDFCVAVIPGVWIYILFFGEGMKCGGAQSDAGEQDVRCMGIWDTTECVEAANLGQLSLNSITGYTIYAQQYSARIGLSCTQIKENSWFLHSYKMLRSNDHLRRTDINE